MDARSPNPADASTKIDNPAPEVAPFSGNPQRYRQLAIIGSIGFHAYLFIGYWAIQTWIAGNPWPKSWWPPILTIASALFFARFSYRWIMRLDAQYGRGSRWVMVSTQVKLPMEKPHGTTPRKK